jgi:hypothetical protein
LLTNTPLPGDCPLILLGDSAAAADIHVRRIGGFSPGGLDPDSIAGI